MLKKFLILSTSVVMFCGIGLAGGDPPEVTPRVKEKLPTPVSEDEGVNTPTPTPKPQKADCGPQVSDMVEGKCLCQKNQCLACATCKKTKCPAAKPKKCPAVEKAAPCPSCPEPQIKEVEKRVPAEYKRWNITAYYGRGPEGMDRTLYKPREGYGEYREYKNYGDVLGVSGSYRFTESFNATAMYITNETYLGGVGVNF